VRAPNTGSADLKRLKMSKILNGKEAPGETADALQGEGNCHRTWVLDPKN